MASKKEIYARYGIRMEGGKIENAEFGFINPLLVNGNSKLGKGVYTWSMLPGNKVYNLVINGKEYSVKGTCPCNCPGCYAQTGFYKMSNVIEANAIKTICARINIEWTRRAIIAQIRAENIKLVRIHASGDFFNIDYIEMWKDIAAECADCTFWTYTKNSAAENAFTDLKNINVVKSVIPGKGFNFGHCDYILACYEMLKEAGKNVYICRCGIDKNQHCVNCTACSKNDYVLFIEHSTEYKAEQDPLFPVLRAVIESQTAQNT